MTTNPQNQQSALDQAKQGNPKAIEALINRHLQPKGITAKVALKNNCLQVMLLSAQVPEKESLVSFVRKGIVSLGVADLERIKIYGRQTDEEFPAWTQEFELVKKSDLTIKVSQNASHTLLATSDTQQKRQEVMPSYVEDNQNSRYEIVGVNGQIILTAKRVIISREGVLGFLTQGLKGNKEIPITRITAIQFKHSDGLTNGYIQFSIQGGLESKGGLFSATQDENTVMFSSKQQESFEEVKRYVDSIIDNEALDFSTLNLPGVGERKRQQEMRIENRLQTSIKEKETEKIFWKKAKPILIAAFVLSIIILLFSPEGSGGRAISGLLMITSLVFLFVSLSKS